jgi:hypothetical protein
MHIDFDSLAGLFDASDAVYRLPSRQWATVTAYGDVWALDVLTYRHDETTGGSAWEEVESTIPLTTRAAVAALRTLGAVRVRSVYDVR